MCGIVGYMGPLNPKDIIVNSLKKLEYRGYDSSGIAILDHGKVRRVRAEGKLRNLEEKLKDEKFDGHLGIGHTRWATHGVPSERNAHPHQVGSISLVHNGIIENYLDIREELISRGAVITSDTDSELVAHLVNESFLETKDLLQAILRVLPKLKGAFSILVMSENEPDRLVAFKDGPPLVVGLGPNETFIVSDVQAAIAHTQTFVYLEDRQIVSVRGTKVDFFDSFGQRISVKKTELKWTQDQVEKKGFSHFMLKEIYEQPQAIAAALEPHLQTGRKHVRLARVGFGSDLQSIDKLDLEQDWKNTLKIFSSIEKVLIVACGTSSYAGMVAKYYLEALAKVPVEVDLASEFRYRSPVISPNTLVITVSQSGETADTLAAIRLAKELGAKTLSICNVKNSTIDREANGHLYLNCGPEIGVASTKAFTSTLVIVQLIALAMAKAKDVITEKLEMEHIQALLSLPSQVEGVLGYDKYFADAAEELRKFRGFLYLGRGVSFPIALEGALKLKELAYYHAEGYAAGEMKHGPLALIDKQMAVVVVAPADDLFEKTVSNLEEAKARGGQIIAVGTGENLRLKSLSTRYLPLPKAHWTTNPIISTVPLQLMAFHLAQSLGYDVDQPRNLAKSVTVE
jgi:glucosamine--fructose-6-phosphate aminotransferase (isomerizing)